MTSNEPTGVSRDLVVAAYQVLLGRDPESERAILNKTQQSKTAKDLLSVIVDSREFKNKQGDYQSQIMEAYRNRPFRIDVDISPKMLAQMFTRIAAQWTTLGATEPYWSVLTHDRFRMSEIVRTKQEFDASGAASCELIDLFCQRTEVVPPSGTCLELGCGVGRVTRFLAKRFDHVIGVDVSRGNLDRARSYLESTGTCNVTLHHLQELGELEEFGAIDFFYSIITLQHNPPPVIAYMLRILLAKLRGSGCFLFQVPTYRPEYKFIAQDYLDESDPTGTRFEGHALPMHVVLGIIQESGGRIKEVMPDTWIGRYGSNTFFGTRD
jgi:SAM-dependent methyltransferase